MRPAPHLRNESQRLEALRRYHLLDTLPEKDFDDLVLLASQICGTPISYVSLVDEKRQWFKSKVGITASEAPREISFCGHAIESQGLFVVRDAAKDARFADNPLVTGEPHIRFYAGAPIVTPDGHAIGTLCVVDHVPRRLNKTQQDALEALARQALSQFELRRHAAELAKRGSELIESEKQYHTLFAANPQPMWVYDLETLRFLAVNDAAVARYGYSQEEFLGMTIKDIRPPEDVPRLVKHIRTLTDIYQDSGSWRHCRKNGSIIDVEITSHLLDFAGRRAELVLALDVTESRRARAELIASQERFEALAQHSIQGIILAQDDRVIYVNPALSRITGYSLDDMAGHPLSELHEQIHPEDRPRILNRMARLKAGESVVGEEEIRIRRKDGEWRWIESTTKLFSLHGRPALLSMMVDVTARKAAEENLRRSEEQFAVAFRASPACMTITRLKDGRFIDVNDAFLNLIGFPRDDVIGRTTVDLGLYSAADRRDLIARHLEVGGVRDFPIRGRLKSGRDFEALVSSQPIELDGTPCLVTTVMDTTERTRAESALRESEEKFRALLEHSVQGIVLIERDGVTYVNPAFSEMIGFKMEDLAGLPVARLLDFIDPRDRDAVLQRQLRFTSGVELDEINEVRVLKKSGEMRWVLSATKSFKIADRPVRLIMIVDITRRREAEQRIEHLNRVYAILSDINELIVRERDSSVILEGACRIAVGKGRFLLAWIGMAHDGEPGLRIAAHAGADQETMSIVESLAAGGQPRCEFTVEAVRSGRHAVCNDIAGDPLSAHWREEALTRGYRSMASLPLIEDGRTIGTFNLYAGESGFFDEEELKLLDELAADISFSLQFIRREQERKRAEEEILWRTALFEAQVDSSIDGILVVDTQGRKIVQNKRLNELWKIPPEIAQNPDDQAQINFVLRHLKDPDGFVEKVGYLYSHPEETSYDVVEFADGTILERISNPVVDKSGKLYGRIWNFRDVTEKSRLEAQLRQSQKLEAIGQLAGGVAHDFNNILAAIMMQADLASSAGVIPAETREMLDEIRAAAERAANLTRQLLAFSRRQVMQPRIVDLNEIVTNVAKMLQRILGEDIRLQFDLHPKPLMTRADAGMIDQVLLNLVVNARDAMPDGGSLSIKTGTVVLSEEQAASIPESKAGLHVSVSVTDSGSGIAPEYMSRIFEPFFTTKEPGKGTGLGLATVFGIVKQHGGALRVESDVGRGTTIEFMLQAIEPAAAEAAETADSPAPRGGTETILLVEDDPAVRVLTRMVLEAKGYKVVEADSGPAAFRAWDRAAGAVDLLFTDLVMPEGIDGHALAAELQELKPGLKVIFTSGYSADIAGRELELKAGQNFLQKPSSPTALLEIVRQSLDS